MAARKVELSRELLAAIKVPKVFPESDRPMSSISFNDTGEYCVTAGEDDSLNVYDCKEGTVRSTLYSKKYGVTLARFTHHKNNVIYASTKDDDKLRYLSLHDNKYIRYFEGHTKRVIAVEMSPVDDTIMTSSLDQTVRLWDLRTGKCRGVLSGKDKTLAAFDPQGLVFAVGTNCNEIRVYDPRDTNGPFAIWTLEDPQYSQGRLPEWTSLKFSQDGKKLIITTIADIIYVLDAFNGNLLQRLVGHSVTGNSVSCGEEMCITPDARFVMAGGGDSHLRIWDLNQSDMDNQPFATLPTPHKTGIKLVGHNPSVAMAATGAKELAFWLPSLA